MNGFTLLSDSYKKLLHKERSAKKKLTRNAGYMTSLPPATKMISAICLTAPHLTR